MFKGNTDLISTFFTFIRYNIHTHPPIPSFTDWDALFLFMKQQALLGVGFCGVERMKAEGAEVPKAMMLKWYAVSERVRARNVMLNRRTREVVTMLEESGFRCCVLKGQGNAAMYPNPGMRTSGDIDVWVDGTREEVMAFVKERLSEADMRFHHVEFPVFRDVPVELHFMPVSMNNPLYNRRMQRWFEERKDEQMRNRTELPESAGKIPVPTWEFNIVYQLAHMMHHFFDEGIGLRQMMDYYYLLRTTDNGQQTTDSGGLIATLKYLNLYHFAGAVMWVLHEVMGLEKCLFIVPADERRGRLLLDEILKGGNFGQHSGLTRHGMGTKYFLKIKRNMSFVRAYPAEALCEPVFRTWHFFWRMWHKY